MEGSNSFMNNQTWRKLLKSLQKFRTRACFAASGCLQNLSKFKISAECDCETSEEKWHVLGRFLEESLKRSKFGFLYNLSRSRISAVRDFDTCLEVSVTDTVTSVDVCSA